MLKIGDGVILLSSLPLGACTLTSLLSLSFSLTPTLCPEPKSRLNWFASDYHLNMFRKNFGYKEIELFIHDSDHSYEIMKFECDLIQNNFN